MPGRTRFVFHRFELDPDRRTLCWGEQPVSITARQLDVLLLLVMRAGQVVPKDDLLQAAWKDVSVGDNSLEQAISSLRRALAAHAPALACIETVPRRGYRFTAPVDRPAPRADDARLEALLEPHRAFIEGRAALETLERNQIARARDVFERAVRSVPELAPAHIGLANACILRFETTRADLRPDTETLAVAVAHAREACRLEPESGEAWATLGFVLARAGDPLDALAASKRAVAIEPDNWRHHLRLSYVSWGEERLRAADRTLALLPGFPLARWLAATVHVARGSLHEAARELSEGLKIPPAAGGVSRFSAVALHWLQGLLHLARGDEAAALTELRRELALEHAGHLYARECCANTFYAIGALEWRRGREDEARAAFDQALDRVPNHPLARIGLAACRASPQVAVHRPDARLFPIESAIVEAAERVVAGDHGGAARRVERALAEAPPGAGGWLLPLEPLMNVGTRPDVWAPALARLRNRAA